ncbi:MAG: hypothetical protein GX493_07320 [Firmicutes bacterium]|nr:hypothetical protein [Bacillota bacterium]
MQAIGCLVVAGHPEMPAALRAWPWLRSVPRPWRRRLVRLAGPKPVLVAESTDGGIQAYGLLLAEGSSTLRLTETLRRMEEKLTFRAFGWRAAAWPLFPDGLGVRAPFSGS